MNTELKLEVGKRYTVVHIGEALAMTIRHEITITDTEDEKYVYKEKGKRKEYYINPRNTFIFAGWGLPLRVDTDDEVRRIVRGNACFNFVGDAEVVRDYIDTKNLNPGARKEIALIVNPKKDDGEELLYPELAAKSGHAVIQRIVKKQTVLV